MRSAKYLIMAMAALTFGAAQAQSTDKAWKPDTTVEFIAPAGPGGGWDLTARALQRAATSDKIVGKDRKSVV